MIVRVREYRSFLEAQGEWRRLGVESPVETEDDLWQTLFLYAEGRRREELEELAFLAEELGGSVSRCQSESVQRHLLAFESGLVKPLTCAREAGPLDRISEALLYYRRKDDADVPLPKGTLRLDRSLVMGILNVTPDSFSDGGAHLKKEDAVRKAMQMVDEGADIVDVGGESTRPGASPVSVDEEKHRVLPVLKELIPSLSIPVSIDTRHHEVASAAAALGASIVNDVSALKDPGMIAVARENRMAAVLMHMQGEPGTMQQAPFYEDVVGDSLLLLDERMSAATNMGLAREQMIIDPGIGFGKAVEHNLEIIRRLREYRCLGRPVMIGASRKSFVRKTVGAERLLEGSLAAAAAAVMNGAKIVRVHDVKETKALVTMLDAVRS